MRFLRSIAISDDGMRLDWILYDLFQYPGMIYGQT